MNKTLLKHVSKDFRKWIHSDDNTKETKLRLVRTLTANADDEEEMLREARSRVATALVAYADGNPQVKNVKPYGLKAARSTKFFKLLPTTTLALTFAALYQVVRMDPLKLDKWIQTPRQNITTPWPRGMVKRFIQLQKVFEENRAYVFKAYEDDGGDYMGEDKEEDKDKDTPTKAKRTEEFEEDFD